MSDVVAYYVSEQELVRDAELMRSVVELANSTFQSFYSNLFLNPSQTRLHNTKELLDEVGVSGGLIVLRSSSSTGNLLAFAIVKPYNDATGLPSLPPPALPRPQRVGYSSLSMVNPLHRVPGTFQLLHAAVEQHARRQGWDRMASLTGEGERLLHAMTKLGYRPLESKATPAGYLGWKYENTWTWLLKDLRKEVKRIKSKARL